MAVVSTRPPAQAPERALPERIATAPDTDLHQLASLTAASVAALVRGRAFPDAPPDFCQTCWEVTSGNPFYLHELRSRGLDPDTSIERELSRVAPPSVLRAVLRRLDRLPDDGAASLARAQGAPQPAVDYLRRALEEPPSQRERPEVLVELARAETAVGDTQAVERLSEAVSLIADERPRAEILLEL